MNPVRKSSAERQEQMRLQKRKGRIDKFAKKEKQHVADLDPNLWRGMIVRSLNFYEDQRFILKDINFALKNGEMFAIFGKSGESSIAKVIPIDSDPDCVCGESFITRFRLEALDGRRY